ncbi:MAG: hypothetical protein ABSA02_14085 [Trebonia sp.]
MTAAWVQGIADALSRGWNAMTFDGPGQNAALVRQRLPFRPDWENVITPVVDYLLARSDVDGAKVAILGVSQAGYWVPRAVAFEHRVAAAVTDPGVTDVSTVMLGQVPPEPASAASASSTGSTSTSQPERPGSGRPPSPQGMRRSGRYGSPGRFAGRHRMPRRAAARTRYVGVGGQAVLSGSWSAGTVTAPVCLIVGE